jgi:septal ring factor EnvC (AmiA/AmiB activator)
MPSNIDRGLAEDAFAKIEAKLALIRKTATAPPDAPESWFKRSFAPAAPSSRPSEIDVALVDALRDSIAVLRERVAAHLVGFEQLEQEVAELRSVLGSVRELQERSAATETMLAQLRREQGEIRDRLSTIGEQLTAGQGNLADELRERIQQVLDEQRVSLRQISLKTSEEAVLADRARRATELRLDEFARRVPGQPA